MDFNQDLNAFAIMLSRSSRDIKRARENFLEMFHHWKTLSEKRFGNVITIEQLPESRGFSGTVLGKGFTITLSPITIGETGAIEAVVTVPSVSQELIEIGRFQVDRDGKLVGDTFPDSENPFESNVSARIFMAVLKAVTEAPIKSGG